MIAFPVLLSKSPYVNLICGCAQRSCIVDLVRYRTQSPCAEKDANQHMGRLNSHVLERILGC